MLSLEQQLENFNEDFLRYKEEAAAALKYERKRGNSKKARMAEKQVHMENRKTPKGSSKMNSASMKTIPMPSGARHRA